VLSGLTAVATFFALNPFIGTVLRYVPRLYHGYAAHARRDESDHWTVLRGEIRFVATEHGWILGAFLLLGILLLIRQLWRKPENQDRSLALLPLSLFIGYPLIHAAGMTLLRTQNLMPAMAGAALICAYGMVHGVQWLRRRARAPAVTLIAGLLLAGLLLAKPFGHAYRQTVPNNWVFASKVLRARLEPLRLRHVAYEPATARLTLADHRERGSSTAVPSLTALSPSLLDLTDAEVFPLSQTQGPQAPFYQNRQQRLGQECILEIHAKPFRRRGAPLLLLLHPWKRTGQAIPISAERATYSRRILVAPLPAHLAAGDVVSLELIRPASKFKPVVRLQPADRTLTLQFAGRRRREVRFLTPRFQHAGGPAEIRILTFAQADPKSFELQLWRWTQAPCK
jgi:hypothetical protein